MTDRLTRLLAAALPDRDPQQIAEAVLLAARWAEPAGEVGEFLTPPDAERDAASGRDAARPGTPSTPPGAADLALPGGEPDPLGADTARVTEVGLHLPAAMSATPVTASALSLFRRVHRPGPAVVDVDATVEATADAQRLVVVSRPADERGLDAAIVVDPTPVALAWAEAVDDLEGTLRRTGAFRAVTRWSLHRSTGAGPAMPLVRDSAGVIHRADQLVDPAGRRLVLVLTDGTGDAWHRPEMWRVLRRWAWAMPTTLVHLLPPSYWGHTAIGQPTSVVRSLRPADPNASLEVRAAWWSDDEVTSSDVPVPVIGLDPEAIVRWSQAVVSGSAWTEAVWTRRPSPAAAPAPDEAVDPADQMAAFEMRATDGAQRLARILAGATVLTLPLIRVLHQHLVPGATTSQIAELLVSGLLERLPEEPGPDGPLLRFRPGVADLLYRGTTITQEWDVYDLLTGYLERNAASGHSVHALVADPEGAVTVDSGLVPFAAMGRRMAVRLGFDLGAPPVPAGAPVGALAEAFDGPRRYLLLCMIGDYDDPAFAPLPAERAEIAGLFAFLGYVVVSVSSGPATRQTVLEGLGEFYRDPNRRSDDLVVLYLYGHGAIVGNEFRFVPADARSENLARTGISMSAVADLLFSSTRTSRSLVVIDSSWAGSAAEELAAAARWHPLQVPWFGVLASTGKRELAGARTFAPAFVATVGDWLENSTEFRLSPSALLDGLTERLSPVASRRPRLHRVQNSPEPAFFARPADPPPRVPYREVVRRIAPESLIERDDELADLAAFCTSTGPWPGHLLVLQGEPLVGKTALLASFVLAPPPRTRVVSFFASSRSRDERDRFVDVVSDQLATILSERLPRLPEGPAGERRLRTLFDRAAEWCQAAGERLVLVVDGLSGDRGTPPGEASSSVAALLPARPPAGMRVVISVRDSWQAPTDVPADHPLRDLEATPTLRLTSRTAHLSARPGPRIEGTVGVEAPAPPPVAITAARRRAVLEVARQYPRFSPRQVHAEIRRTRHDITLAHVLAVLGASARRARAAADEGGHGGLR